MTEMEHQVEQLRFEVRMLRQEVEGLAYQVQLALSTIQTIGLKIQHSRLLQDREKKHEREGERDRRNTDP